MALTVDILQLFPELAAISHADLQVYCDEWLQRPLARGCGIAQVVIDDQRNLQILIDASRALGREDRQGEVFLPLDELLDYIVDRHFSGTDERRRLHATIRDTRHRWQ